MGSMNIQDPAEQEKVRRRTHDYVEGGGRHGSYVAADYHHKEYPKFMDRTPAPKRAKKQTDEQFQSAFQDWEDAVNASVVNSKAEEIAWLAENGQATKEQIEQADADMKPKKSRAKVAIA